VPLSPGDKAPVFNFVDQHGNKVKPSDFKGAKVLVYFYPKTWITSRSWARVRPGTPGA
jgi:peroxiredoxin